VRRRSAASADDRLGAGKLRTDKSRSFFLDHRLGRTQLGGHGQDCPRRDHIASIETEFPQIRRALPVPEQFEDRVGRQSKALAGSIPPVSPDA
jgi:hypothetical protein